MEKSKALLTAVAPPSSAGVALDNELNLKQALQLLEQGDFDNAKLAFEFLVNTHPRRADYYAYLAESCFYTGLIDLAYGHIERAIDLSSELPHAHYWCCKLSGEMIKNGEQQQFASYAQAWYESASLLLSQDEENHEYHMLMLEFVLTCCERSEDSNQVAQQHIDEIKRFAPNQAYKAQSIYYQATGQAQQLNLLMDELLIKQSDNSEVLYFVGRHFIQQQAFDRAFDTLSFAQKLPITNQQDCENKQLIRYAIAELAMSCGEYLDHAIDALADVVEDDICSKRVPAKFWAKFQLQQLYLELDEQIEQDSQLPKMRLDLASAKQQSSSKYQKLLMNYQLNQQAYATQPRMN